MRSVAGPQRPRSGERSMSVGECHRRSIAKAVSWRATGTLDTFVLSWLITGNLAFAGSIAGVETMTKMVLYYGHERLWAAVAWGRGQAAAASGRTRRIPSLVRRTRTGIAALTGAGTRACHPLAGAAALGALIAVVAGSPLSSGGRRARVAALSEPAIPAPVARIAPSEV